MLSFFWKIGYFSVLSYLMLCFSVVDVGASFRLRPCACSLCGDFVEFPKFFPFSTSISTVF